MRFNRPEFGETRKKFAWIPTPLHDFSDGFSISSWVWLESYSQEYRGHYWGWKNPS